MLVAGGDTAAVCHGPGQSASHILAIVTAAKSRTIVVERPSLGVRKFGEDMTVNAPADPTYRGSGRLRVEGLSNILLDSDLRRLFQPHGTVLKAWIIPDPATGLGSGSGFVEMRSTAEAGAASLILNDTEHLGRKLKVIAATDE